MFSSFNLTCDFVLASFLLYDIHNMRRPSESTVHEVGCIKDLLMQRCLTIGRLTLISIWQLPFFDVVSQTYTDIANRPCQPLDASGTCPSGYSLCGSSKLIIIKGTGSAPARPPTINGLSAQILNTGVLRDYPSQRDNAQV